MKNTFPSFTTPHPRRAVKLIVINKFRCSAWPPCVHTDSYTCSIRIRWTQSFVYFFSWLINDLPRHWSRNWIEYTLRSLNRIQKSVNVVRINTSTYIVAIIAERNANEKLLWWQLITEILYSIRGKKCKIRMCLSVNWLLFRITKLVYERSQWVNRLEGVADHKTPITFSFECSQCDLITSN